MFVFHDFASVVYSTNTMFLTDIQSCYPDWVSIPTWATFENLCDSTVAATQPNG